MAGAGYKLFNTGDVLTAAQVNTYLMEQTVMVFADAAARTAALSGVVSEGMISYLKDTNAVEVYNGSAWVASDDPNAIQNTIVDAKGDLITATAADVPARLAVGANGETLVADSSASTGLRWQGLNAAGRNLIINGNLDFFQRGTSGSIGGATAYTADRWNSITFGGGTMNWSRTTLSNSPVGSTYALRIQRPNGATNLNSMNIAYTAETADSLRFAGQNVTLSFWARAGANYSSTSSLLNVLVVTGTGTDQSYYGTGLTNATNIVNTTVTLTTSWQKFTVTGTVGSSATQLAVVLYSQPTGTAGANDWFEFTQVQLESGSVATPFTRAGGTLAGELQAAQRYYVRASVNGGSYRYLTPLGSAISTTQVATCINLPASLRDVPSAVDFSTLGVTADNGTVASVSAVSLSGASSAAQPYLIFTSTGLTQFRPYWVIANNSSSAFIGLSAEL